MRVIFGLSHLSGTYRVRVFENRVFRKMFNPKTEEVIGGSRKLHDRNCMRFIFHEILLG
jgi:hypothetical protein